MRCASRKRPGEKRPKLVTQQVKDCTAQTRNTWQYGVDCDCIAKIAKIAGRSVCQRTPERSAADAA